MGSSVAMHKRKMEGNGFYGSTGIGQQFGRLWPILWDKQQLHKPLLVSWDKQWLHKPLPVSWDKQPFGKFLPIYRE